MATINVKDAAGSTVAIEKPLAPGRAAAGASRPVALSDEDKAALDAVTTALVGVATDAGLTAIVAKLSDDPATQTTLAAVLAKLSADPATQTTLAAVLTALGSPMQNSGGSVTAIGAVNTSVTATIANGASETDAIDCDGKMISFIEMPAAWTTAALSMKHASDTSYTAVYDQYAAEWNISSANMATLVGKTVFFDPPLIGRKSIKLRSGLTGAAVNQGAARAFVIGLVP